jgi:hypothetical protein
MNTKPLLLVSVLALTCLSSSCQHIPLALPADDTQAKTFETRANACGLYVYREDHALWNAELELELDGIEFGATGPGNYLFTWLPPGKHDLESHTDRDMRLNFVAKAGTLLFVRQTVAVGYWLADSKLDLVEPAVGQKGVRDCTRVLTADEEAKQ